MEKICFYKSVNGTVTVSRLLKLMSSSYWCFILYRGILHVEDGSHGYGGMTLGKPRSICNRSLTDLSSFECRGGQHKLDLNSEWQESHSSALAYWPLGRGAMWQGDRTTYLCFIVIVLSFVWVRAVFCMISATGGWDNSSSWDGNGYDKSLPRSCH